MVTGDSQQSPQKTTNQSTKALDRLLKRIYRTEEFPAISKYITEINHKLSLNPDTSNASELANIILKDHALTSKLLKMVNSAYYGLAAGKVSTVSRAVVVLGYENVRLAILSLTLFEHFKGKSNSTSLREAVVASFWSGMMARELAATQDGVDPEEAFVCGMMSHLGKLVMIYYLPEEYRNICKVMDDKKISETKATRLVSRVTYMELGVAVARQWNFPDQIHESMRPLTRADLRDKKKPLPPLQAITSFVREVYEVIQADQLTVDSKIVQSILERYQPRVSIADTQLLRLVKDSLGKVHRHAQALSLNPDQDVFLGRLAAIHDSEQENQPTIESTSQSSDQIAERFQLKDENQQKATARIPDPRKPKDIIMEGIQELSQIMINDCDIDTIAVMSLEIFYRALDFHRALLFIKDKDSQEMTVRFGFGCNCRQLIDHLRFNAGTAKDLFNMSIQVGKDLIVADAYDAKMIHLIPPWYREKIDAPSFVFLPIHLKKACIGALYADRDTQGLPISETEHHYLSMLRNQLILSIKYKQKSP
jgi:eukaryotic-like serine/threonine-protein kinase